MSNGFKNKLLILMVLALAISILISIFQEFPGYMDADYYFAGGIQLAEGNGFTEPYLWNYFDPSNKLPHPSHGYWMPLTSIIAAGGMVITGAQTWVSGRLGFYLIGMFIPALTAILAFSFTKREDLSLLSGILAIFSGYYSVYMQTTDSFSINMILGGLFFLIAHRDNYKVYFLLGLLSGLFHLARADGVFWLGISLLIASINNFKNHRNFRWWIISYSTCLFGYILVMGPWFFRNYQAFGSLLGPQASNMIWLTHYNQVFSYPPNINFNQWWIQGLSTIVTTMISALKVNLLNTIAVLGNIILFPFILIGSWKLRKDVRIGYLLTAWIGLMFLMSLIYPFAGMRGGFFHAGAALQPALWAIAPVGLEIAVEKSSQKRRWNIENSKKIFSLSLVAFSLLITVFITFNKLYDYKNRKLIWGMDEKRYQIIGDVIKYNNSENSIVIVGNPPGYYLATGGPAIAIPDGDLNNLLKAADDFNADYLILEPGGFPKALDELFAGNYANDQIDYLSEIDEVKIYKINHNE